MKPFNLQKALAGELVVTEFNDVVSEIYKFKTCTDSYSVAYILQGQPDEIRVCTDYGVTPSEVRLYMAPKKVTKFILSVVLGDNDELNFMNRAYDTFEEAEHEKRRRKRMYNKEYYVSKTEVEI